MIGEILYLSTGNILCLTTFFYIGFIAILLRQIVIGNTYSLYTFYLLMSAFFMYNRFILGPYLDKDIMTLNFAGAYSFPPWVGEQFISIATCSIIVMDFVYSKYKVKNKSYKLIPPKVVNSVDFNFLYYKLGIIIMSIFIIPLVYKIILQVQHQKLFENYAVANFTGQIEPSFPWWTRGAGAFFYIGFLLFIYSFPAVKKIKYGYFLFFIMMAITALKGGRAFFFTYILSTILIFKKLYGKRLSTLLLIFLPVCLIFVAIFLGNFRNNMSTNLKKGIVGDFLYGQTTTMGVPYVYLEKGGNLPFKQYPYILTYLVQPIKNKLTSRPQNSLERLRQSNNYGTVALYTLNPDLYKVGAGLGLNFLTEAYDFGGYWGVILWSVFLSIIIKTVDCIIYTNKNRLYFIVIFFVYQYILFLPRHTFFGITDSFKYIIGFLVVYWVLERRSYLFKLNEKGK